MNRARSSLMAMAALPLALAGCVTIRTVSDGVSRARIGETAMAGPVAVIPERVIEDSRCPAEVQCVWAGQVRIAARVDGAPTELTLGKPAGASGGTLTFTEVYPPKRKDAALYPDEYRFGFTFAR